MKQIEALAKAAVGYDAQRGDQFSLQNVTFTLPPMDIVTPPGKFQRFMTFAERWTGLLRYAAMFALFAVVYMLILRPVKKKFIEVLDRPSRVTLAASRLAESGALAGGEGSPAALPSDAVNGVAGEVQQAVLLKKQLTTKVKEDPETASRLIQNWIRESEGTE